MSYNRDTEEELRREFERLRDQAMRSMMPMPPMPSMPPMPFPPFFGGMNPAFPEPFPGIFTGPTRRPPVVPPPTYEDVEMDPEEEVMRRVMEESKKAEEERRRKLEEEEERKLRQMEQEQMNLDYLAQEDDEMLQQSLLASLRESSPSAVVSPPPALKAEERKEMMDEGYGDVGDVLVEDMDEDEEIRRALELSVEQKKAEERRQLLEEAARKREEQQKREEEERRQRELAAQFSHSEPALHSDEDEDIMHAIAASLEAEREAKRKREEEKRRKEGAMLEEQVRRLVGSMNGVFDTKESDMPFIETEEDQREKSRRQAEIDERQLLRNQQDEEYRASLERDRFLENERLQKEAKEAQEKREKERKEAEAKRKKEELERRKQARIEEMRKKRETLPEEPREKDPNATSLSCRLPTGARVNRRFLKGTRLAAVKDWVDSVLVEEIAAKLKEEEGNDSDNAEGQQKEVDVEAQQGAEGKELWGYDLVTDFPRKTFSDLSITLEEAGLVPRALISVAMH